MLWFIGLQRVRHDCATELKSNQSQINSSKSIRSLYQNFPKISFTPLILKPFLLETLCFHWFCQLFFFKTRALCLLFSTYQSLCALRKVTKDSTCFFNTFVFFKQFQRHSKIVQKITELPYNPSFLITNRKSPNTTTNMPHERVTFDIK